MTIRTLQKASNSAEVERRVFEQAVVLKAGCFPAMPLKAFWNNFASAIAQERKDELD